MEVKPKCEPIWPSLLWLAAAIVACAIAMWARSALSQEPERAVRLMAFEVYDGDTLTGCVVDLGFGVHLTGETIRIAGYDAPEITKRRRTVEVTDAEIADGKLARDELKRLCARGSVWFFPFSKDPRGVYGRLQGTVLIVEPTGDRIWVDKWMQAQGHVRD